jgi:prephenate dehydrogenase
LIGYGEVGKSFTAGLKAKPGVTAIADKQQSVADQAAARLFDNLPQHARWQDDADVLMAHRPPEV